MKRGTQEFYELQQSFEKAIKSENFPLYGVSSYDRVSRDEELPTSQFYNDGVVNQLFHAFMAGYANAKCLAKVDALPLND